MKSTGTVQLLEQLQQWQFPAILTDASGKVLEENITNFDLKITDQLRELLVRYQPGSVFNWGERGMRVLPGPGCSAGERLFLIVPPEQAQMEQLQSELDDYTDKVEKMHYLQEMLETRGAELNIAHQRLLDNSRKLEQTGKELKERQSQMQNNFDIARRIVEELFPFPAVRHG
ncbi:hypothetical protein H8D51_02175, partial [bacterium]|nr:hypothetical protein [bacterium]